jgi:8-oxo-dGTP pyrophosphatase MutT (NUDIX family)
MSPPPSRGDDLLLEYASKQWLAPRGLPIASAAVTTWTRDNDPRDSCYDQHQMRRIARDVSIHLFRRTSDGPRFLMLRRTAARGGFWQGVSGAPLPGETDAEAAVREVREETGFDVGRTLTPLDVEYSYALRPELADHWERLYGPGIAAISVVAFGAEVLDDHDPVLDPEEHDAFAWCSYSEASSLLDWPIEKDALEGRRKALQLLASRLPDE